MAQFVEIIYFLFLIFPLSLSLSLPIIKKANKNYSVR